MERVDIKIGFQCNNLCQFCVQGDKRFKFKNRTLEEIKESLKDAKKEGSEGVVFTGGEPTIHPDILAAVKSAHDLGFKNIQIQSSGRMFAYLDFCKKLVKAGANEFSPALHGSKPEIHDGLTSSPGSFEQVVKGIKNLKSLGQYVLTNTVINSKNYQDLPNLAQLFINLGVDQFQFAFVHILGTAAKNKDWLVPKMSEVMPFVKKGLDVGVRAGKVVMTEAIPYCLMQGYEDYIAEKIMPETKIVDAEGVIECFSDYRMNKGKTKRLECQACKFFKICEGPWKEYPEIYGWEEFQPVSFLREGFIKLDNYDEELSKQISDLYKLGKIASVYKFQGHSCNKVHLFEFEKNKVIVKFFKGDKERIFEELNLLDKLSNKIYFSKLFINKLGQPFFEYNGDLIKVYEFIDGERINPEDYLDEVCKFIKIISKIDFSLDGKKEKVIPYHNLDLIKSGNKIYFLESEHLAENFYPFTFALAKYIADIIDKSRYDEGRKLNIGETIKSVSRNLNFMLDEQNFSILKSFLLAELKNRISNSETVDKYKEFYEILLQLGYGSLK